MLSWSIEIVILSEINQTEKEKCHVISLICRKRFCFVTDRELMIGTRRES